MKEARIMIIGSIVLSIVIGILTCFLNIYFTNVMDYFDIATNLYCGIIVGLLTSICQYCLAKRKIINSIYGYYFDIYTLYYYTKEKAILKHYNSYNLYKKIMELSPKIRDELEEYHGLFKKEDKTYKKLNPVIKIAKGYKGKNIEKSFISWFNKKSFDKFFDPFIKEIEGILISINKEKFEKDKSDMVRLYNYLWSSNNEK